MQITICNKKVICRGIGFLKLPFNNNNNSTSTKVFICKIDSDKAFYGKCLVYSGGKLENNEVSNE